MEKWSKEYKREYFRKYYKNNKDKISKKNKKWNDKNKDKRAVLNKEYRNKNKDYWVQYKKTDKFRKYQREYYHRVQKHKNRQKQIDEAGWDGLIDLIDSMKLRKKNIGTKDPEFKIT